MFLAYASVTMSLAYASVTMSLAYASGYDPHSDRNIP
jgi:hypothetical protein